MATLYELTDKYKYILDQATNGLINEDEFDELLNNLNLEEDLKSKDEIIANKHGNGHENRRKSLGISASEYAKVRAEVNRRAGVSVRPQKTIEQMAREVVDGKHGNGHANRQRSLGIDNAAYQKVRARVNQIM